MQAPTAQRLDTLSLAPDASAFTPGHSPAASMSAHPPMVPQEVAEHVYSLSRYPLDQVIHWLQTARMYTTHEQQDFPTHTMTPDSLSFHTQISPRVSVASSDPRFSRASSIFTAPSSYRMSTASSRSSVSSFAPQMAQVGTNRTPRPDACPGKYVCSHCDVRFKRNWDWKFHEETFHERWRRFDCNQCNQSFWSETKFNQHHRSAHGCQTCPGAGHAQEAEVRLRKRTAWGCGYCGATLLDWDTRCKHITQHIEAGLPKTSWKQTSVILGLLHQPKFAEAWKAFVVERHGSEPINFCWARRETAELQEALEYAEEQNEIEALVSRAYELGHVPSRHGSHHETSMSPTESPQVEQAVQSSSSSIQEVAPPPRILETMSEEPPTMQMAVSEPMDTAMEMDHNYLTMYPQQPVFDNLQPHFMPSNAFFMGHRQPAPRTDKELPALPAQRVASFVEHDPNTHANYTQHLDGSGYENWSRIVTPVPQQNNFFAH